MPFAGVLMCAKMAAKANKTLSLIKRSLEPCSTEVKDGTYTTLVRPALQYASSSWNPPSTDTDGNRLEGRLEEVQKNAARVVCNDYKITTTTYFWSS